MKSDLCHSTTLFPVSFLFLSQERTLVSAVHMAPKFWVQTRICWKGNTVRCKICCFYEKGSKCTAGLWRMFHGQTFTLTHTHTFQPANGYGCCQLCQIVTNSWSISVAFSRSFCIHHFGCWACPEDEVAYERLSGIGNICVRKSHKLLLYFHLPVIRVKAKPRKGKYRKWVVTTCRHLTHNCRMMLERMTTPVRKTMLTHLPKDGRHLLSSEQQMSKGKFIFLYNGKSC